MIQGGRSGQTGANLRSALSAGILLILGMSQTAHADEAEFRQFNITIDGRHAGRYRLTIESKKNQGLIVDAEAKVVLNYLIYRYTYSFHGQEYWQGGRLARLQSESNDNGKRFRVDAVSQDDKLRVTVNGKTDNYRADVWTTTYWQLPDKRYRNQGIPLLDADTGRYLQGRLEFVDRENIMVAGTLQPCAHYSVSAPGIEVEAWYDGQERLVRQTAMEDGHRTVMTLSALERR